ncbi:MAG: hypothetical protein WAK33_09560 [Silvibacterium sp.]
MSFKSARYLMVGIALGFGCSIVVAQEVVHAVTGVVTGVDTSTHTITLKTNDGSQVVLQEEAKHDPRFDFDKALEADATRSADFNKQGDPAIVYYFGMDENRKAVAVKDLGTTALKSVSGQITHWDHHRHVVTIKTASGAKQTFQLDDKTAVETPMGVVNGDKFEGQNGDQISIRYSDKGGNNEAVFLSES